MKENTRNLAVGVTAIIALAILGGMVLLFTGLPVMFRGGYKVKVLTEATYDAHAGDLVYLSGMKVGSVTDIQFTDFDHPTHGVTFVLLIDKNVRLPSNSQAHFYTKGFVGSAYIELKAAEPLPKTHLPTDGSAIIKGVHLSSGMIPQELSESLQKLADNLNAMVAPPAGAPGPAGGGTTAPATGPAAPGVGGTLAKLNATLDAFNAVLGDQQNQANIKTSLANLAKATAAATEAMESLKQFANEATKVSTTSEQKINDLAAKLTDSADKISDLMTTINKMAAKIDSGEGTAGKIINDPQLYNSLVDATKQMTKLMDELRDLVKVWQTSGVPIKTK